MLGSVRANVKEMMNMRDVIESIEHEAFSRCMNPPESGFEGQADIKTFPDGTTWIVCPWCMKKQFKIGSDTKIEKLRYNCKNSKCKREFLVNTPE